MVAVLLAANHDASAVWAMAKIDAAQQATARCVQATARCVQATESDVQAFLRTLGD